MRSSQRESDYYREAVADADWRWCRASAGASRCCMGLGAIIGAVLTMYSAVVARVTREIATSAHLGFGSFPVLLSILGESMVLRAGGGILGGAHWPMPGLQRLPDVHDELADVQPGGVRFCGDTELLTQGIIYALIMGLAWRRAFQAIQRGKAANLKGAGELWLGLACPP